MNKKTGIRITLRAKTLLLIYLNFMILIATGIVWTYNAFWGFVLLAFGSYSGFRAYESFKELTTKNLLKKWKKKN